MLIIAAIVSIRSLPTTAYFGTSLIFFYLLSALLFLIPVALISAEFASRHIEEGGIFHWVRYAFGDRIGVLAVWLQWINTVVWYPTMLLFISGTAGYILKHSFVDSKFFLLAVSLITFWILTLLNLKGIQASSKLNSLCATLGTIIPMAILIFLGLAWLYSGNITAISFHWKNFIPDDLTGSSVSIVTIMSSFLGMELAGVHIKDIKNPKKNFPIAIGYAVFILLATFIFGALSIAVVIPKDDIRFVDGVMQTFSHFLENFHLSALVPVLALCIIIGSTGGSVNWLLSPAQGLFQIAEKGFLPKLFLVKNNRGVAHRILILQAIVVSLFCCMIQFVSNINSYYWFLMALSTGLYMLMYILLFLAALKLKKTTTGYQIPFGLRTVSCILGLLASLLTIVIGFQPAPGVIIENPFLYVVLIFFGFCALVSPVLLLWRYQKKRVPTYSQIAE